MLRAVGIVLGSALVATASGFCGAAEDAVTTIAHRQPRLVVDGSLDEWDAKASVVTFAAPTSSGRRGAEVSARLCWDRTALWVAFEVADPQVHLPPEDVSGPAFFQWDSVEIYLDGLGDRTTRMGRDDFQVIVTSDGRTAVLQGDPLLAELEPLAVPKREREGIAIPAAARRAPGGYVLEVALPWAAFGLRPDSGDRIALDLAVNDWDAGHPQLPMMEYDLPTLIAMVNKTQDEPGEFDIHGLTGAAADLFTAAHYHPWAWSGSPDFGHPESWPVVTLVGSPAVLERLTDRIGVRGLLLLSGSTALLMVGLAVGGLELRHRRQIAGLMTRISLLEAEPPADAALEPPSSFADRRPPGPAAVETLEDRIDAAARRDRADDRSTPPLALEARAVRATTSRVGEPLSPAQLADELCVSLRTLQRDLSATLQCTPRELIIAVKMREARRLLQAGWRVQEVAERVGFDDSSHFSRRFKAYVGVPPSELASRADADSSAA